MQVGASNSSSARAFLYDLDIRAQTVEGYKAANEHSNDSVSAGYLFHSGAKIAFHATIRLECMLVLLPCALEKHLQQVNNDAAQYQMGGFKTFLLLSAMTTQRIC